MPILNGNIKTNRRPKKRSFRSWREKQACNPTIREVGVRNRKLSKLKPIQYRTSTFPHEFTKHFQINDNHKPTPIRVHFLCNPTMQSGPIMYQGGFSFMFSGPQDFDWGILDSLGMLKEQVVLFAQCMGAEMLAEEIGREWPNMQIRCRPKLDKDGIRHMLITSQV